MLGQRSLAIPQKGERGRANGGVHHDAPGKASGPLEALSSHRDVPVHLIQTAHGRLACSVQS